MDLIFLGRMNPDKGFIGHRGGSSSGRRSIIAGIIQDQAYFREQVEPHLNNQNILYIGTVDVPGKNELFADARALLHMNTIPERFGLVLVEANAAGVPVIAMDLGACPGGPRMGKPVFWLATSLKQSTPLSESLEIDPQACRRRVRQYFSIQYHGRGIRTGLCDNF